MVLLAEGSVLATNDLPDELRPGTTDASLQPPAPQMPDQEAPGKLIDSARVAIAAAILTENGNFTRAAARLGIAKSTLYEKMKRYGIDRRLARLPEPPDRRRDGHAD